jgi:hypothetical protein
MMLVVALVCMISLAGLLLIPLIFPASQSSTRAAGMRGTGVVGQVTFRSSGQLNPSSSQGLNDIVTVNLGKIVAPARENSYYAWLLPEGSDQIKPLLIGRLSPTGSGTWHLSYQSPDHRNIVATWSLLRVTEESRSVNPVTPSLDPATFRFEGSIPNRLASGETQSYLTHLRHLLATEPTLDSLGIRGGVDIWLYRNSEKVLEYATAARDGWASGQSGVGLLRRQIVRILQYLDGATLSGQDIPAGTPLLIDPLAGRVGLLDLTPAQDPPGYLSHELLHLEGLITAPSATQSQQNRAIEIDQQMQQILPLYQAIRSDAIQLVKRSDQQLLDPSALSLLDDVATRASVAYAGQVSSAGAIQQGISWVHGEVQSFASFDVMAMHG